MKTWQDYGKEWLDTLVVAISVAMAFRAYFFEPFQIPTGSMRPTLYGNHTVAATPSDKSVWDLPILSLVKFAASGTVYKEFRAPWSGTLYKVPRNDGNVDVVVDSNLHPANLKGGLGPFLGSLFFENEYENLTGHAKIPMDAAESIPHGVFVKKGDLIWNGQTKRGDFIFVNRIKWNFYQPTRGEVMIFSTTGIAPNPAGRNIGTDGRRYNLQQGTHYIKRLMGGPGETLEIRDGKLFVNGVETPFEKPVGAQGEEPKRLCTIPAEGVDYNEPLWKQGVYRLDDRSFFAAGDNSYPERMSYDSRYWGPVPRENLRGNASLVFWPFFNPRWGNIK